MADPIDIKMSRGVDNLFDIAIDENTGDFVQEDGFDTAIYLSFFMERRASESEVQVPEKRRGWIGNELNDDPNDEWGSKNWIYSEQGKKTNETVEALVGSSEDCFEWMIEQQHMQDVTFDGILTVDGIILSGEFRISPDEVETRNFNLWEFTGGD